MTKFTFDYLDRTGLTQEEVLRRAKEHRSYMFKATGWRPTLQQAIDSVIDAAAEYAQG